MFYYNVITLFKKVHQALQLQLQILILQAQILQTLILQAQILQTQILQALIHQLQIYHQIQDHQDHQDHQIQVFLLIINLIKQLL